MFPVFSCQLTEGCNKWWTWSSSLVPTAHAHAWLSEAWKHQFCGKSCCTTTCLNLHLTHSRFFPRFFLSMFNVSGRNMLMCSDVSRPLVRTLWIAIDKKCHPSYLCLFGPWPLYTDLRTFLRKMDNWRPLAVPDFIQHFYLLEICSHFPAITLNISRTLLFGLFFFDHFSDRMQPTGLGSVDWWERAW